MVISLGVAFAIGLNKGDMPLWGRIVLGIIVSVFVIYDCHLIHVEAVGRGVKLQKDVDRLLKGEA